MRDGVADGERTGTIQFHHAHTRTVHDVEDETVRNAVGGESEQAAAGSWAVGGIHLVSSRGESRSRSEHRSVIYVHQAAGERAGNARRDKLPDDGFRINGAGELTAVEATDVKDVVSAETRRVK